MNLLSLGQQYLFISLRWITWFNSQLMQTRTNIDHHYSLLNYGKYRHLEMKLTIGLYFSICFSQWICWNACKMTFISLLPTLDSQAHNLLIFVYIFLTDFVFLTFWDNRELLYWVVKWNIEFIYRKVASSSLVYYWILNSLGQRSHSI